MVAARDARADASAWMAFSSGPVAWKGGNATTAANGGPAPQTSLLTQGALRFDVGTGTSPDGAFIVGGLFRLAPILGSGTDLAILARGATHGFQAGGFGVAASAGAYGRFWGTHSGGFLGEVTLGAPAGLQLSLEGSVGSASSQSLGATLGMDFLRLTVFRQTLLDYWSNPSPAQKKRGSLPRHLKGLAIFL